MEKIIFIKPCKQVELAHLYEHLWSAALTSVLRERRLFEYLDYFQEAVTYNTGFIYIELYINKEHEQVIRDAVHGNSPTFSKEKILIAIHQIMAEKQMAASGDVVSICNSLTALHKERWIENTELSLIDSHAVRRTTSSFWLTGQKISTSIVTNKIALPVDFVRDSQKRPLLPLFYVLVYTLNYLIRHELNNGYGFYSYEDNFGVTNHEIRLVNKYRVERAELTDLTTEAHEVSNIFHEIMQEKLTDHMAKVLSDPNYATMTYRMDESIIYKHTGVLMGGLGWQKYATLNNLNEIFKELRVELSHGRNKIVIKP